jgi:hypothetical protein
MQFWRKNIGCCYCPLLSSHPTHMPRKVCSSTRDLVKIFRFAAAGVLLFDPPCSTHLRLHHRPIRPQTILLDQRNILLLRVLLFAPPYLTHLRYGPIPQSPRQLPRPSSACAWRGSWPRPRSAGTPRRRPTPRSQTGRSQSGRICRAGKEQGEARTIESGFGGKSQ